MRNKIVKLLVISLFLLLLVGCSRSEYTYTQNGSTITISEYTGSDNYLVVPDVYQERLVDIIDYNTYAYNINLIHVRIGNNILVIRECAFWYCYYIESIYIPSSVKKIEECAFYNCEALKDIYFEETEGALDINIEAFNDCFDTANLHYGVSVEEYETIIGAKK